MHNTFYLPVDLGGDFPLVSLLKMMPLGAINISTQLKIALGMQKIVTSQRKYIRTHFHSPSGTLLNAENTGHFSGHLSYIQLNTVFIKKLIKLQRNLFEEHERDEKKSLG